jgi:hypothetical protein
MKRFDHKNVVSQNVYCSLFRRIMCKFKQDFFSKFRDLSKIFFGRFFYLPFDIIFC